MPANNYQAFLKQVSPGNIIQHLLSTSQSTVIGRDATCQIVLNSPLYKGVSRRHLEIRPLASSSASGMPLWQICDLQSTSGTFINGQRLQGCQTLQANDRIRLGASGPEFIFEYQSSGNVPPVPIGNSSLHMTQMFPILSGQKLNIFQKGFLIPGIVTVFAIVAMFATIGSYSFFNILAVYLSAATYYFIYRLCGKHKPWWLILGVVFATILFNQYLFQYFAFVFRDILPGDIEELINLQKQGQSVNPIDYFVRMFFAAGLLEELTKALPVFALYLIGRLLPSPWRERIGVWEPLDGILLVAASAVGFTLDETLGQYVPNTIVENGALIGLQLLIPRILGSIAGHMAYSGYFGYFIGLSVLKPKKAWQIVGIGYLTSALVHTLWNSVRVFVPNDVFMILLLQAIIATIAFVFLVGAILKARQLSPTRAQNSATQYHNS